MIGVQFFDNVFQNKEARQQLSSLQENATKTSWKRMNAKN